MGTQCEMMFNPWKDRCEWIPSDYIARVNDLYVAMVNNQSVLWSLGMDTNEFAKQIAQIKNFINNINV